MQPCTHPGMKRLFCLKAKNGLIMKRFFCPNGLITSREVKEARRPHTCSRPCAFEEKTKIEKLPPPKKSRTTQNTPRNPQQPGDRDRLKTARDETRPTRLPILACFHRSRVCGNRPGTALAISKNHECYTYTDGHRRTDRLNNGTLYAPRYEEAFLP